MIEVPTFGGSIHIIQTDLCVGDGLSVHATDRELEQNILEGALVHLQDYAIVYPQGNYR